MIHHTAVSYKLNEDQLQANNRYHKRKWGFISSLGYYLGYNYEISKRGKVVNTRADGEVTAACRERNLNDGRCIHIALDGNFEIERVYPYEIWALRDLLIKLCKKYNITKEHIHGHNEFSKTKCPGKNMDMNFVRGLIDPKK